MTINCPYWKAISSSTGGFCTVANKTISEGVCRHCLKNDLKGQHLIKPGTIQPVVKEDNMNQGLEKFSTCQFRSEEKIKDKVKVCCGRWSDLEDYKCEKLNLFPLKPEICLNCQEYKKKL